MPETPTGTAYAGRGVRARVEQRIALAREREPGLRSLVLLDDEGALAQADRLDAATRDGRATGPLHGVVVVVKDNIDVAGQVTGCCSAAASGEPAAYDAPLVARLRAAGAVLLGRANMDELAMGASTATSVHGATRNPWDHRRSPGGSSGGCAAAVAVGIADLAVGTDTGGSIREPSAQCGVWGLAPSPALVPVEGVVPFAPSCDRVGPIAADPGLLRTALAVMASADVPTAPVGRLRVGLVVELADATNQPEVLAGLARTVTALEASGVEVVPVHVADAPKALAAYLQLTSVECLPHLEPWTDGGRAGREVVRRTSLGRRLRDADDGRMAGAATLRARLVTQVGAALAGCDALLSPTMPTTAPRFAPAGPPTSSVADPMLAPYTDCWTVVANLTGLAAVSVPAGLSSDDDMPVGAMLMGPTGSDGALLDLAEACSALSSPL